MPIVIHGHELSDAEVQQELPQHAGDPNPLRSATLALLIRHAARHEAQRLGLPASGDDEALLDQLLAHEVPPAPLQEGDLLRHYEQHAARFRVGASVEVAHILFQVTDQVPLELLRAKAQEVLDALQADPSTFAATAGALSNCPSAAVGGQLGQVSRGEMVPEFEQVVFTAAAPGLVPRLVESRFGLHIVRLGHRDEGRQQPFEEVQASLRRALQAHHQDTTWRQYVRRLLGRADIQGIELPELDTALVQ